MSFLSPVCAHTCRVVSPLSQAPLWDQLPSSSTPSLAYYTHFRFPPPPSLAMKLCALFRWVNSMRLTQPLFPPPIRGLHWTSTIPPPIHSAIIFKCTKRRFRYNSNKPKVFSKICIHFRPQNAKLLYFCWPPIGAKRCLSLSTMCACSIGWRSGPASPGIHK